MSIAEKTFDKLAHVAEIIASAGCEAVAAGQELCPVQYDRRDDWCLPCRASEAVAEYHQK